MVQAIDIITDALIRDGVYAPGESISDADAERCLSILNDMLDSWSNESLYCYDITEQSGLLIAGQSAYTIGTTGSPSFNMTRPLRLIDGYGAAYIQDAQGNPYQMDVYQKDKWNLLNRSNQITSNFPTVLYYDPQYPLGILNFWPQPNTGGYTAFWDSYLQLTDFSSISATFNLPPGYKDALQKNLMIEIWPDFLSGTPDQLRIELASKAKGNIKRTNIRPVEAVYDPEIVARSQGTYNWKTDGFSR